MEMDFLRHILCFHFALQAEAGNQYLGASRLPGATHPILGCFFLKGIPRWLGHPKPYLGQPSPFRRDAPFPPGSNPAQLIPSSAFHSNEMRMRMVKKLTCLFLKKRSKTMVFKLIFQAAEPFCNLIQDPSVPKRKRRDALL